MFHSSILALALFCSGLAGEEAYLAGREAEDAGRYQEAIDYYARCAAQDKLLAPYALIRAAKSAASTGNGEEAIAQIQQILDAYPSGPWTLMARAYLGDMLRNAGRAREAAAQFQPVLTISPQPWWFDHVGWSAAQAFLSHEDTRALGYAYYRDYAENVGLVNPRLTAGRKLVQSPDYSDRAAGILAMYRSYAYSEAKQALKASTIVLAGELEQVPLSTLLGMLQVNSFDKVTPALAETLIENNPDNPWVLIWLIHAVHTLAQSNQDQRALELATVVAKHFGKERDTGDLLWWLARYYEQDNQPERSEQVFLMLAREAPTHWRADDALFHLAERRLALGRLSSAEEMLLEVGKRFPDSRFRSEAQIMASDLRREAGDEDLARLYLAYAAHGPIGNFFAHRAFARLQEERHALAPGFRNLRADGANPVLLPFPEMDYNFTPLPDYVVNDPRVQRMRFFGMHGLEAGQWESMALLESLADHPAPGPYYRVVAEAGFGHTSLHFALNRGWGVVGNTPTLDKLRIEFPLAYWPLYKAIADEVGVDPFLGMAIAKQESTFRASIQSHAGATGVMQLMPATANWMADVESTITEQHVRNLKSPVNSIRLGMTYLKRMIDRSDGNLIYALAAYNAGPGNLDKWRRKWPDVDMDTFVNQIPFSETKDYVKKVLGNYAAYHSLYPLSLLSSP